MQFRLECQHSTLKNHNCLECGLYIHPVMKISGLKTQSFRSAYPGSNHIAYLRKLALEFQKTQPQHCRLIQVKNTIETLVEVLGLNREVYAQSLYIYEVAAHQMIKKKCYDSKYAILYTAASIVLSAKTIFPEKSIPPMQGIKRILGCNYGKKELCKAQRLILKMLNYKIPNFTFLDFLNFYLMNGAIFSNQQYRDALKFQYKIDGIAWSYIKNVSFMRYDQESLAIYILYRARNEIKVPQVWNWHIEYFTQTNGERLKHIIESIEYTHTMLPDLQINELDPKQDRVLRVSNTPRQRGRAQTKLNVEQSIKYIKRGYSNIKRERSNSQSHCGRLQPIRTGSSLNKFAFRVQ